MAGDEDGGRVFQLKRVGEPGVAFVEGEEALDVVVGGNFNEHNIKPFTAEDVRFTTKAGKLYAILMGAPKNAVKIKSLGTAAGLLDKPVASVRLIGADTTPAWSQNADALAIEAPYSAPNDIAVVFEITLRD